MASKHPEVNEVLEMQERLGISAYAACKRSGISISTVDRWKHNRGGNGGPQTSTLRKYREAVEAIAREKGLIK